MTNKERFIELMDKYISGTLTPQENDTLKDMLDEEEYGPEVDRIMKESYQQSGDGQFWNDRYRSTFEARVLEKAGISVSHEVDPVPPAHRIHFLKTTWFRYAAAVVFCIAAGAYLWTISRNDRRGAAISDNKPLQTDIGPGGEKAVLTLADGGRIVLDSAANGALANQGGVRVVKLTNGQIAYDLQGRVSKEVLFNTMSTPKGGQYQVVLPDGTKVWLNASSAITFPTAFAGNERKVKISGELYFEVARNKQKPFIVDVDGKANIQVLGTSFNINSYADEGNIKTTLLEGSVQVSDDTRHSVVLKPGYQAVVRSSGQQPTVAKADIDQVLAWKNGLFNFNGSDLRSAMRQLERWYDIKVRYEGEGADITLKGEMYRNVNLTDVLEFLKDMGLEFRMEGKTLIVH